MHNTDAKPKRKNDDKPKGRPRRRALIAGLTALLIVLIAGLGFTITRPRFTPMPDAPTGKLVYADQIDYHELDFQTGTRARAQQVTLSMPSAAASSPDGHWSIYFAAPFKEPYSLLHLEDLTEQEPLRTLGTFGKYHDAIYTLSWSPDQQWVAFSAQPHGSQADIEAGDFTASEIWMVHIPTGEIKRLTNNSYRDSYPIFSPDGTQLAYISTASGIPGIYLMDVATGESRLFTADHHVESFLWSPDGQWIACTGYPLGDTITDYRTYMYVIRMDGTLMQLTTVEANTVLVEWKS